MTLRPTLQEEFPHLLSIVSGLPVGPFVDSLCDLICPGCFPHLGALLSPSFCPVQCLDSFMSQLVPPLHSFKATVFCMVCVVCFCICECVCVDATACVRRLEDNLRCWSPPSTLLQVCVRIISFLLFAAVYVRLAICWGDGGRVSCLCPLSVHRNTGIAEAHTCTPLSMGPHSCTAST